MASEVIERKIVQIGLDKKELVSGLQKAVKDVESFQSKLSHIKTDSLEKISSAVENVKTHFSNLLDKIPIVSTLKDHIAGLGKKSSEAAVSMSELNQNGNFSAIISGSSEAFQGMGQLGNAISGTSKAFSILEGAASVALGNIATKAIQTAGSFLNKWTLAPVIEGYQEYERELDSTRMLVSALGEGETDHITAVMRDLEQYAKTTRYSSQEMNAATAQFVNAGIGLDESAVALKGWGNLAASASASTADFNRTLQTSVEQAMQMGYMNLQNWRQIQNANMATKKFKDTIVEMALAQGDVTGEIEAAIDAYGELNDEAVNYLFNERLSEGQWFNNDVMLAALTEYANDPELVKQAASLYTFKEALEATEEAVSDAWSKFWVEVVGKGDEAVAIWTPVGEIMQNVVSFIPNAMTQVASVFNQLEGRAHVIETFKAAWEKLTLVFDRLKITFKNVFPDSQFSLAQGFINLFDTLTEKIKGSGISAFALDQIFTAFWRTVKIGMSILGGLFKVLDTLIPDNLIKMVIDLVGGLARLFNIVYDGLASLGKYVNTSPMIKIFRALRDTIHEFWDYFAELLELIIVKTGTVINTFVQFGAHIVGFFGGKILTGLANHWEALLAPIALVGTVLKGVVKVLSAVWDEANRVYDVMGRIAGFASRILLSGAGLFGKLLFGSTVYADELDGMSESMEENIPITERLGRKVDELGKKLMDSASKFKMNTEAIIQSKSPIKALTSTFKSLGTKLGDFFNFKDFIAGLRGVGSESKVLTTKMGQLGNFLKNFLRIDWKAMISGFKKQTLSFGKAIETVDGWLKNFVDNLDFSSKVEFIKSIFVGIGDTFTRVGKTIGGVFGFIGEGLVNLGKWISDFANSKTLSNLIQAGTLLSLVRLLNKLSNAVGSFSKIPKGISDVLVAVGGVLKSYQKEIKAKSIREIATALLLMSGALFVISTIPTNKLLPAVMTLASMATILVGAYTTIKYAQRKFGSTSSKGIMGNVVDALGLDEVNKLAKKIGTATMLVSLGATLLMIIKPFQQIAEMSWGEILQGVIGMGAVLTEIVGATWLSGLSKADMGTAFTIYALGKVLKACVDILKPLAAIDGKEYDTGLLKLAGLAAVISGAVALMSGKFEFFKTGLVNVEWGSVNFGTVGTILSLSKAIGDIVDSFAIINKYSPEQIDSAMNVIRKIAASIRNAIMLMTATLTLGTDGTAGTFKIGKKAIFTGLPQMGAKFTTGGTKWSLAATILAFAEGIKLIIDSFDEINKLEPSQIDRGVKTINRIVRSLTLAIAAMSFTASLELGVGFKGKIGTSGMNWAQSLGIAVFVAGLLFLTDQLEDLAKIEPERLEAATKAIKTISNQLGILFVAMNIAALGQNHMDTDMATMALTIGMMGTVIIALKVVGDQLMVFSTLNKEQLGIAQAALFSVGGTVTAMTAVLALISAGLTKFGDIKGIIETLALLGGVVLSLKVVGDEFIKLGGMTSGQIANARVALKAISEAIEGMVGVLAIFGLVAGVAATFDPLMLAGAAEILLLLVGVVVAIKVVGDEFIKLGGMTSGQIANARVALEAITEAIEGMVGVLAIFGLIEGIVGTLAPGVLVAVPETMDGAVKAAKAIAKLGPTFIKLGAMDSGSISRAKKSMTYIQNALSEMVKTGFWESWFKNWSAVKDKMSATNTAAKAMKNAGSALEEIGAADVSVYEKGNSNLDVIKKGIKDMLTSANEVNNTVIGDTALENARLLRSIMKAIGDAFDEASNISTVDTSGLQASVSNLATSAVTGLSSPEVLAQYGDAGQGLVQSTRSGVDIMAPYMGDGGALAAGSFVLGVQSGQINANQAGNLLTKMAQSGASAEDLYIVAQTLGGTYTQGIFSLNGKSYDVGSGLTSQANKGAGSGVGALSGTGRNVSSTFSGGVSGGSGLASTAGKAVLEAAKVAFSQTFGISSSGEAIVSTLAGGIRGAIHLVESAASDVMQAIKNFFPHSPAPEGPFSGKGWTAVGSSGRAVAEEWVGGLVAGFDEDKSIEGALSQVQKTITAISDYTYDNLTLTPTITPVVDMSGIDAANLQFAKFKMANPGVIETKVSYDTLNQASLQAAQTKHNIDTVVEGMNVLNHKLTDIAGINTAQTNEIKKGQFPTFEIDGYKVNKQLAPGMQAAQNAYMNQVNRRGGILPTL